MEDSVKSENLIERSAERRKFRVAISASYHVGRLPKFYPYREWVPREELHRVAAGLIGESNHNNLPSIEGILLSTQMVCECLKK
jgi:hypothetical protein